MTKVTANPMAEGEYSTEATLKGHSSSVVTLEFSPDGSFLASSADDGTVLIYSTSSWVPLGNFVDASPVTAMAWYVGRRYLLFCGYQSGDLHLLTFTGLVVSAPLLALRPADRCRAGKLCRSDFNFQRTHPFSIDIPYIPLCRYCLRWRGSLN